MRRHLPVFVAGLFVATFIGLAQQPKTAGEYRLLKSVKVGGDGGFDYIFADVEGRRLYVPRTGPMGRVSVYNLDTLEPAGEVANVNGRGAVVDPKSHHGFASSKPIAMWDTNTQTLIKTIDVQGNPDGIMFDTFNDRVWSFSHAAPQATVINATDGAVVAALDLGGAAEQAVSDGKGHVYVNLTDKSNIAVVDARTMTVTAHYDLSSKATNAGGLALDAKNHILFSYLHSPSSMAVIVNADNGQIITTLPTGDGVDTVAFNPATMEAISADGAGTMTVIRENSPTSFVVEQTVQTMQGAKTLALDTKTNRLVSMTAEYGAAPPPAAGGRAGRAPVIPGSFTLLMVGK